MFYDQIFRGRPAESKFHIWIIVNFHSCLIKQHSKRNIYCQQDVQYDVYIFMIVGVVLFIFLVYWNNFYFGFSCCILSAQLLLNVIVFLFHIIHCIYGSICLLKWIKCFLFFVFVFMALLKGRFNQMMLPRFFFYFLLHYYYHFCYYNCFHLILWRITWVSNLYF